MAVLVAGRVGQGVEAVVKVIISRVSPGESLVERAAWKVERVVEGERPRARNGDILESED